MAIREVPAKCIFVCDGCLVEVEATSASSRPKHWSNLHVLQDAYDFQGCAVADGSVKRALCHDCTEAVCGAINHEIELRRSTSSRSSSSAKQQGSRCREQNG